MRKLLLPLLLVGLMAVPAMADLVSAEWAHTAVPPAVLPGGYIANDLVVVTTTDWLGCQMVIGLSAGGIYNHAAPGNISPPDPMWFPFYPALQFDSFLAAGQFLPAYAPSIDGAAVDLPPPDANRVKAKGRLGTDWGPAGDPVPVVNPLIADVAWGWSGVNDIGTLYLARVVLPITVNAPMDSVIATVSWKDAQSDPHITMLHCFVENGEIKIIPEPGTWVLLICGALSLLAWRRR